MSDLEVIGHEKERIQLNELLARRELHSTLLFVGIEGIGKKRCAFELSSGMLCENVGSGQGGCGVCKSCMLCATGFHPDRHLVECSDKDTWSIDSVRDLLYSLNLKPFHGSQRVVIFNDVESLSVQSCNLLLKTLEEPRPGTSFILISSNPSKLLITLRSRCQIWSFAPLDDASLKSILESLEIDEECSLSMDEVVKLADGSVGIAKLLIESSHEINDIKDVLVDISKGEAERIYEFSLSSGKDKLKLRTTISLCRIIARQKLVTSEYLDDQAKWASFLNNIIIAEQAIFDRNVNASLALQFSLHSLLPQGILGSFTTLPNSDTLLNVLR